MFQSLRARLWLSYAVLLLAALLLTASILVIYLLRSPLAYRQIYARMEAIQGILLTNHPDLSSMPLERLDRILRSTDDNFSLRFLVYTSDRVLLADSRQATAPALSGVHRIRVKNSTITLRDSENKFWLVFVSQLEDGKLLLVATKRPRLAFLTFLRNDILPPFLVSGLASLFVSLIVAYGLARWISKPIQQLVDATGQVPDRKSDPLPLAGPREVQVLTQAFNTMRARVLASQRSQREFVANVSHELKTPLTSIQGFAQSLRDGTAHTPGTRQHAVEVIQEETARMHRMVLDLLDLARLDAGTLDLQNTEVNITSLLHSIVDRFSLQAKDAGVTLNLSASSELPILRGDGDRLAQVFGNLMDNALKFTPSGGFISLRTALGENGAWIQVEIADSGTGISAEDLAHIFERFYQADTSRSGGGRHGAGLGLAIVKEIIAAHGGTITAQSTLGEGTTFFVHLPVDPGFPTKIYPQKTN